MLSLGHQTRFSPRRLVAQKSGYGLACGRLGASNLSGRTRCDDSTTPLTSLRAEFDDVIRACDEPRLVFDDDQRVSAIHELGEHGQQPCHVALMKSCRRLIQNVQRRFVACPRRQLHR
jgi:hypothetical protein